MIGTKRRRDEEPGEPSDKLAPVLIGFCVVYVFAQRSSRTRNRHRRSGNQLRHAQYKKPELLATSPNQVWSWDITKLL
jgi:hypothetical protein